MAGILVRAAAIGLVKLMTQELGRHVPQRDVEEALEEDAAANGERVPNEEAIKYLARGLPMPAAVFRTFPSTLAFLNKIRRSPT